MKSNITISLDVEVLLQAKQQRINISGECNNFLREFLDINKEHKEIENLQIEEDRLRAELMSIIKQKEEKAKRDAKIIRTPVREI